MNKKIFKVKVWIAKKLFSMARYFYSHIADESYDKHKVYIIAKFDDGTTMTQTYSYENDATCLRGLTKILGFNPFEGLLTMFDSGIVKDGDKSATMTTVDNAVYVNDTKVYEKEKDAGTKTS